MCVEQYRTNCMVIGEMEEKDTIKHCGFCGCELSPLNPNRCVKCGKKVI